MCPLCSLGFYWVVQTIYMRNLKNTGSTLSMLFIKIEASSTCGQDATEHWVNKRHLPGNGNMVSPLSLFDVPHPKLTQGPQLAEPRDCQLKPWKERLKEWRTIHSSTGTRRYKQDIREFFRSLFCPQRSILWQHILFHFLCFFHIETSERFCGRESLTNFLLPSVCYMNWLTEINQVI